MSQGLPGTPNVAYAEWTQATIEPNRPSQVPEVVRTLNAEMQARLDSYEIVNGGDKVDHVGGSTA